MRSSIKLRFESLKLPPAELIVIAKNSVYGKRGLFKAMDLLSPGDFELFEVKDDEVVDAILITKRKLKKIPYTQLIPLLKEQVFPYIAEGEVLNIDVGVIMTSEENITM